MECHITSDGVVKVGTRTQVGVEVGTKDIVRHRIIMEVVVRIVVFLGIPGLIDYAQTCSKLEVELKLTSAHGRDKKVRIHRYSLAQVLTLPIDDRQANTQSSIVKILLPRALLL